MTFRPHVSTNQSTHHSTGNKKNVCFPRATLVRCQWSPTQAIRRPNYTSSELGERRVRTYQAHFAPQHKTRIHRHAQSAVGSLSNQACSRSIHRYSRALSFASANGSIRRRWRHQQKQQRRQQFESSGASCCYGSAQSRTSPINATAAAYAGSSNATPPATSSLQYKKREGNGTSISGAPQPLFKNARLLRRRLTP